jgi:hypothetical protein
VFMRDRDPRQPGWPIFADAPPAAKDTRVRDGCGRILSVAPSITSVKKNSGHRGRHRLAACGMHVLICRVRKWRDPGGAHRALCGVQHCRHFDQWLLEQL